MANQNIKLIFDTSPLITLCVFSHNKNLVFDYLIPYMECRVADEVLFEATDNPTHTDALAIQQRLTNKQINQFATPNTEYDTILDKYTKLGKGERDSIRLALTMPEARVVIDDHLAFVVASRFGVKPLLLLDLIVLLAKEYGLDKTLAYEITEKLAPRYSESFILHTKEKLRRLQNDTD